MRRAALSTCTVIALCCAGCGPSAPLSVRPADYPIVGGEAASGTLLAATGALVVDLAGNHRVFCSAAVVGERLALTAAHCMADLPPGTPAAFFAGLTIAPTDPDPPLSAVTKVHLAPGYAGGDPPGGLANFNDIALLELAVAPAVKPLRLVRPDEVATLVKLDAGVLLAGFGQTVAGQKTSTGTLQQGASLIGEVGQYELYISGQGAPQKCHGDSGGPTMGDLDQSAGYDLRLIGVTSRADVDCTVGSIETRVDVHLDWIHAVGGSRIPCGSGLNLDCPPQPKQPLGASCSADEQCHSGLCVAASTTQSLCSEPCTPGLNQCPLGYVCTLASSRPGTVCLPEPPPPLAVDGTPCATSDQCAGGLCAHLAGQSFCSSVCHSMADCDDTMLCMQSLDGPRACVPRPLAEAMAAGDDTGGCSVGGSHGSGTHWPVLTGALLLLWLWRVRRSRCPPDACR